MPRITRLRPVSRRDMRGFHIEQPEPMPRFAGLFQSRLDLEADLFLAAHGVDDEPESDLGGEA